MKLRRALARLAELGPKRSTPAPEDEGAALQKLRVDLLASQLFDPDFYLAQYSDVREAGVDPVEHYIRYGGFEGRDPSLRFDSEFYLDSYPDLRAAKVNPLVHYVRNGRDEGRLIQRLPPRAPRPEAPSANTWRELAARRAGAETLAVQVDVVVPVHSGFHETANCLHSVLESREASKVGFELVVIDDRSPEPELSRLLEELAGLGLFTLLKNESNLGFVASVNLGFALHGERDVVLLNSDTEVYGDWVDRLRRAAYSDPWNGTVTPFSNNATICSYPYLARPYRGAFEIPFAEIDRLASEINAGRTAEIPTGVGFCMYLRRDCLDESGTFDERAFGRGYGEENDFCQRIAARGWRNVLAGDVFVRHLGNVSFGTSTEGRIQTALEIIKKRYPRYLTEVGHFLETDPPKSLRRRIDVARLRRANGNRSVLFWSHGLDGGTLTHIHELSRLLAREGVGSLQLRPLANDGRFAELGRFDVDHLSASCRIDLRHGVNEAIELLRDAGVAHIHVHHLLGYSLEAIEAVPALAGGLGVDYDFTAHDYLAICPRLNMTDASGVYCNNHDIDICESCVNSLGSRVGDVSVRHWRDDYRRFFERARRLFVPHEDGKKRLEEYFPGLEFIARPHPEPVPESWSPPIARREDETLRVAVIGAIGPPKGSVQLLRCAEDAARRRLPIQFVLVGFADLYELNTLPNVVVTGRYAERDLPRLLTRERCHMAFFPSIWPETYCYTLSRAFFAGLFPVAYDIGAIAARIRSAGWGLVLPWEMVHDVGAVNNALLAARPSPPPVGWRPVKGEEAYRSVITDYYGFRREEWLGDGRRSEGHRSNVLEEEVDHSLRDSRLAGPAGSGEARSST